MAHKFCPQCGITLKIQGVSIAYTRFFCYQCNRVFEVLHPNAPSLDAQEGEEARESEPYVSFVDIILGRMHNG